MKCFLVGHYLEKNKGFRWEFIGIFTNKEKADFNCIDEYYFYAPIILDKAYHGYTKVFPNIVYPRAKKDSHGK